jgi:glycosyltransferase involved in cell wall biosynthesis
MLREAKETSMHVSLIITTYNWPEALVVTLRSALQQSYAPFEIIIADDGSNDATLRAAAMVLRKSPVPWRHVRHADKGIRQARIKNLGVKYAQGEYFVFIDHDVALHPEFLKDHMDNLNKRCFLQGKRVFLSQKMTNEYLDQGEFRVPSPLTRGLENRKNALRLPRLGKLLTRKKNFQTTLRGCNLSMHRTLFTLVDGYDEIFDGLWGREDSDICYRLFNSGCCIKNVWFSGIQYHLHHSSIKRTGRDRLDTELDKILSEGRKVAVHGFSKLSEEGEIVGGSKYR